MLRRCRLDNFSQRISIPSMECGLRGRRAVRSTLDDYRYTHRWNRSRRWRRGRCERLEYSRFRKRRPSNFCRRRRAIYAEDRFRGWRVAGPISASASRPDCNGFSVCSRPPPLPHDQQRKYLDGSRDCGSRSDSRRDCTRNGAVWTCHVVCSHGLPTGSSADIVRSIDIGLALGEREGRPGRNCLPSPAM